MLSSAALSGAFPDGQTKLAFLNGWVKGVPGFPAQILEALRGDPRPGDGSPLVLESAVPGEREFATDRGRKRLPAWSVQAQGVDDPIWVLDPATRRQSWQPPGQEDRYWRGHEATLGTDGRTLTGPSSTTGRRSASGCPQKDSNLRTWLRRPVLYPLSYGGQATPQGYQSAAAVVTRA